MDKNTSRAHIKTRFKSSGLQEEAEFGHNSYSSNAQFGKNWKEGDPHDLPSVGLRPSPDRLSHGNKEVRGQGPRSTTRFSVIEAIKTYFLKFHRHALLFIWALLARLFVCVAFIMFYFSL